jgi:hypothetical protein
VHGRRAFLFALFLAGAAAPTASAEGELPPGRRTYVFTAHMVQVSPGYTVGGVPVAVGDRIVGLVEFGQPAVDFYPDDPHRAWYAAQPGWRFVLTIGGVTHDIGASFAETWVKSEVHEEFSIAGALPGEPFVFFDVKRRRDDLVGGSDAIPLLGREILDEPAWEGGYVRFMGGSPLTYAVLDHLEEVVGGADLGPVLQALAALQAKVDALEARLAAMDVKLDRILAGLPGRPR